MNVFTTKQIANQVGVHPNTVRLYEKWRYISPVKRKSNGYRIYTEKHLEEMIIARIAFPGPYPVNSKSLFKMINAYINENYTAALNFAKSYKESVIDEQERSKEVLRILDQWHKGQYGTDKIIAVSRKSFASVNQVSVETIRTWERNGLYEPEVNTSRYKKYSEFDFEKVQIIRMLRKRGFSIASLAQVFNNKNKETLPSIFLEKIYINKESVSEADEWLSHIEEHIRRSEELIERIDNKIKVLKRNIK